VGAAKLVGLPAYELFPSAAVLRDQAGVDQDFDVLLYRGEADRIEPAEFTDGALTVESLGDDAASRGMAEGEQQPVDLPFALQGPYLMPLIAFVLMRRGSCRLNECGTRL
jgi:hypothetical protein